MIAHETELQKSWTPSASGLRRWRSYTRAHSAPLRPLGSQGAYSARSSCISRSAWARCSSTARSTSARRSSIFCWRVSCCQVNASVMSESAIGTMSSCIHSQTVFPPTSKRPRLALARWLLRISSPRPLAGFLLLLHGCPFSYTGLSRIAGVGGFPMKARFYPPCRIFMQHPNM
jgi:hypothetical protein